MRALPLIIGTTIALVGCTTTRHVRPHEEIAPAANVTVVFADARDLRAASDSPAYVVPAVRSLSGRVESVSLDTLVVLVEELAPDSLYRGLPHAPRLVVVRDTLARVSTRRFSAARTVGLGLLVLVATFAIAMEHMCLLICD
jgi:hypothetical protein